MRRNYWTKRNYFRQSIIPKVSYLFFFFKIICFLIYVFLLLSRGENGTDTCQVTIEKQPNVCQLRLDFEEFTLAQPDENGLCTTDSFMVRTTVGERLPILCGDNSQQHSKFE